MAVLWVLVVAMAPALVTPFHDALVLIPSQIQVGIQEKICLLQPVGEGSGSLRVTLHHAPTNTTVEKETAGPVGHHGCMEFTVPDIELTNEQNSVAEVTVIGSGLSKAVNVTKRVLLQKTQSLTFVQTDKPVYKPGQTVRFRVVSLTQDFLPADEQYPLITLWDPQQNRIGQWRNVKHKQGIVDLSYDLNPEPLMGTYKIEVITLKGKKFHTFTVEEYVLPKFEVTLKFPDLITIVDKSINVRVCGRYTYGKPMRGVVNGTVCLRRYYARNDPNFCHNVVGKTDNDGCFSRDLSTALFRMRRNWRNQIYANFELEEDGTGIRREKSATCSIASEVTRIHFEDLEMYYKKGLPLSGKVVIKLATGKPLAGVKVYLFNSFNPGAQEILVNDQGEGTFCLDTSEWEDELVSLMAIYHLQPEDSYHSPRLPGHSRAQHSVKQFYSKSKSFLSIMSHRRELPCTSDLEIPISYIIKVLPDTGSLDLEVSQLVMARGRIVSFVKSSHSIEGTEEGSFTLHQQITPDLSPIARILVFTVLPNGEVIADAAMFSVAKCFHNQVQLQFSSSEELPGTSMKVNLQAQPGSLCGLRVVDQSVLLLKPEKELTIDSIYSSLPTADLHNYHYLVMESDADFCEKADRNMWVPQSNQKSVFDVSQLLEGMGLKIFTDLDYHAPVDCEAYDEWPYLRRTSVGVPVPEALGMGVIGIQQASIPMTVARLWTGASPPEEKVREYFPETWIWDLVPVSSTGQAHLDVTVPDAITEWKGSAFCSGDAGFGLSQTASLIAFKPFFVDLVLPYSVVRTEGFSLKAKVFNYMSDSLKVKITLEEAEGFDLASNREHELCVLSKDSVTISWNLTASGLGEVNITVRAESISSPNLCGNEIVVIPPRGAIDIIRKPLIIEPEGSEVELSRSSLLCPAGKEITEKIHLQVPEDVVEGSARAYVTVLGDLMGSAMENLDHLLKLPTGCGEQNMVKFAPNIYVLSYLQKTHQLKPQIKDKALGFLRIGYQRQLNYKHVDGSFSAFGSQDQEGNTWLTAFVLKSFLHAQPYIFIDDSVLQQAASFFLKYRLESGCFGNVGKLLHSSMKGGVDDSISLSAYVTTALLELQRLSPSMADTVYKKAQELLSFHSPSNGAEETTAETQPTGFTTTVLEPSLACLRKQMETVNNTYTLALLAYTFTLAGDDTSRDWLLKKLEGLAIKKDGMRYWTRKPEEEKKDEEFNWYWWRAPSAEVEMTAYVLLALLSQPHVSPADLQQSTSIVGWLVRQRNAYGGFASTQDTVVALHALSLYGSLTHVSDPQGRVTLTGKKGSSREIQLDTSNQLVLQTETLQDVPGDYTALVSGSSCLLLQTILRYNTLPKRCDVAFLLSAEMKRSDDDPNAGTININVTYVGPRAVSNMVIVDVKMLSGYSAQIAHHPRISKIETEGGHLVMYIPEMDKLSSVQVSVPLHRDFVVENLQDAYVKVYDYYETDESAIAGYHWPTQEKNPTAT
ncbi:alpha-2-macroglobulin-like isoform X3 [Mobula hypostoma]|uniref:alpha-2-macroglobulin-like isoform X3 n=1 Tax=Mobula hypostoma TaxID=723540 RepID=UPI002FC2C09F